MPITVVFKAQYPLLAAVMAEKLAARKLPKMHLYSRGVHGQRLSVFSTSSAGADMALTRLGKEVCRAIGCPGGCCQEFC